MMHRFPGVIALVLGASLVLSTGLDAKDRSAKGVKLNYKSLNAKALKEYNQPVHPGRGDEVPFWNGFSYRFIYAPAFDFKEVPGAVKYLFTIRQAEHDNMTESMEFIGNGVESRNYSAKDAAPGPGPYKEWTFKADSPQSALSPVWSKVPVGRTELVVEGLDKSSVRPAGGRSTAISLSTARIPRPRAAIMRPLCGRLSTSTRCRPSTTGSRTTAPTFHTS